ncbi:hypothetical protein P280DRAFT_515544 [Massarina eburnea CBS 473.64]|uniref:Mid2 domain-containing protein n=1 Tax=Massarina eburnea CBS 473.64 TaxID=1395130 RepID=A0A6A6S7C2_9PLEO|nr:hypothetical protein P280DRAFT_515544 [Massarina eburnea CBS 473.64]
MITPTFRYSRYFWQVRPFVAIYHDSDLTSSTSIPLITPPPSLPFTPINPATFPSNSTLTTLPSTSIDQSPSYSQKNTNYIGIGVGVGIGGLVLISVLVTVFYVLRRRRQKQQNANAQTNDGYGETGTAEKPELHGESIPKHEFAKEVVGDPVFEMPDSSAPVELGGEEREEVHVADNVNQENTEEEAGKNPVAGNVDQENKEADVGKLEEKEKKDDAQTVNAGGEKVEDVRAQ